MHFLRKSKAMQNHLEISSKNQFWIQNVEVGGKHKDKRILLMHFLRKMLVFASRHCFWIVLTCSWVSWPKNDAERSRNYFNKSALDPKHAKFDQNPSFGHVPAVGGIMGFSGSVNLKHLLRYVIFLKSDCFYNTSVFSFYPLGPKGPA